MNRWRRKSRKGGLRGRVSEEVKGGSKYRMIEKVRSNLGHTDLEMMDEERRWKKRWRENGV